MKVLCNFGLEKPLNIESLLNCSVGAWKIRNVESSTDDGGLACEVSEGSKDSTGTILGRICGVCSSVAKEAAMINIRPETLT